MVEYTIGTVYYLTRGAQSKRFEGTESAVPSVFCDLVHVK